MDLQCGAILQRPFLIFFNVRLVAEFSLKVDVSADNADVSLPMGGYDEHVK